MTVVIIPLRAASRISDSRRWWWHHAGLLLLLINSSKTTAYTQHTRRTHWENNISIPMASHTLITWRRRHTSYLSIHRFCLLLFSPSLFSQHTIWGKISYYYTHTHTLLTCKIWKCWEKWSWEKNANTATVCDGTVWERRKTRWNFFNGPKCQTRLREKTKLAMSHRRNKKK